MRQAYGRGITRQAVNRYQDHGEWEDSQSRIQEFPYSEDVRSGIHVPTSDLPYNMRPTRELYKLFVNGIHSDTTENGLRHIFSYYGNPISIQLFRTRNNLHQPIAFVEFESKYEADNAIVGLDEKPPLNWEVTYATRRSNDVRYDVQDSVNLSVASNIGRQTGLFQVTGSAIKSTCSRQSPCFIETDSSLDTQIMRSSGILPGLHPQSPSCHVCGKRSSFVCVVCKTRYCSAGCQSRDWPTHQLVCRPSASLLPKIPRCAASANGVVSKPFRDCLSIASPHPLNGSSLIATRHDQISPSNYSCDHHNCTFELANPDSYFVKGKHPLDRAEKSNQLTTELPVTVQHNLDMGSERRIDSVKAIIVENAKKSPSISEEHDHPESLSFNWHTINQLPLSQSESPNSNWKSDETHHTSVFQSNCGTSENFLNNDFAQKDDPVLANKLRGELESLDRSRSFCLGSYSPATTVVPLPHKEHPQSPKVNEVYAKKYPSTQLKPPTGGISKVGVCSAESPDEFYVQYYDYLNVLKEITMVMDTSVPNSDPLVIPAEGLPCLALFHEDGCWYRAEILKILPDGIMIRYVDFGNTVLLPNSSEPLKMMEHSLADYPFCAIKVKLANVLPVNGIRWDTDVKKKFKELVENKNFFMEFVRMDVNDMCVRLKNPDGSDPLLPLIQEKLIKKATLEVSNELDRISSAIEIPAKTPARQIVPDVANPSDFCSQFIDENVVVEAKHKLEKTEKEITGFVPTTLIEKNVPSSEGEGVKTPEVMESNVTENGLALDETIINPQELSGNKVLEESQCQMAEVETNGSDVVVLSSKEKISEDDVSSEFLYDDGPFLDLPEKGNFQALIIKAENPQLIMLRVENHEISTKLSKLQEDLTVYAADIPCDYSPKLNEICIVRFPDGQWYRSVCLGVLPGQQPTGIRYLCNQVDYGGMDVFGASEIRCAKKWIIDFLPYLAQHAILEGTDTMEQMEPKLVKRFKKILPENTVVDVSVVSRADMSYVIRIPEVNATLSFERLLQLDTQTCAE